MTKKLWLATCAVSALTMSAGAAWAQTTRAAPPASGQPAAEANGPAVSNQVVVTAEKRAENIQHVPVAITAFSGKTRDLLAIQNVQDLSNFTPGFTYSQGVDRSWIRGIGRNTNSPGTDSGVAFYQDGFFESSNYVGDTPPLFTDQINVLNGPQGTLYGRNAIGGALNVISPRPTKTFYAEVRAAVENYDHYKIEGVVSGPITDWLRFRVGASEDDQEQGYFKNLTGVGGGEGNKNNEQYYDAQLEADLGPNANAWVHYIHGDWNNSNDGLFLTTANTTPFNSLVGPVGATTGPNPGQGSNNEGGLGNIGVNPYYGTTLVNPAIANESNIATLTPDHTTDHYDVFVANVVWHAPGVDVKYIGGYEQYRYQDISDSANSSTISPTKPFLLIPPSDPYCAGASVYPTSGVCTGPAVAGPNNPGVNVYGGYSGYVDQKSWWSHEIDLISTDDGPLKWIVGGYVYQDDNPQIPAESWSPNQTQLSSPCPTYTINFDPVPGAPALNGYQCVPGAAPLANPGRYYSLETGEAKDSDYAFFAQIDYKFTDALKFTAGIRYTSDHKTGSEEVLQDNFFIPTPTGELSPSYFTFPLPSGALAINPTALPYYNNLGVTSGPGAPGLNGYQAGSLLGTSTGSPQTPLSCNNLPTGGPIAGCHIIDGGNGRTFDNTFTGVSGTIGLEWQPNSDTLVYAKYSRGYKAGGFQAGSFAYVPLLPSESLDSYEIGWKQTFAKQFTSDVAAYYYNYKNDQDSTYTFTPSFALIPISYAMPLVQIYGVDWAGTWSPTEDLQFIGTFSYTHSRIAENVPQVPGALGSSTPSTPQYKVNGTALYTFHFDPGSLTLSATGSWRSLQYSDIPNTVAREAPAYGTVDLHAQWNDAMKRYTILAYVKNVGNVISDQFFLGFPTGGGLTALNPPRTYGIEFQYRFQ